MSLKRVRGTYDILPFKFCKNEAWKSSEVWSNVLGKIRDIAFKYSLNEVHTPVIEPRQTFSYLGDVSDIVNKEMYEFKDKKGRDLVLRPEGTSPLAVAIEESSENPSGRMYYIAPMFRYDRPQKGRYRQHMQFGIEILGDSSVYSELDVISIAKDILDLFKIKFELKINYIGQKTLLKYSHKLKEFFIDNEEFLSEDSKDKINRNQIRILDSKDKKDREIIEKSPRISDFLDKEDSIAFDSIKNILKENNIKFQEDDRLVRGLDYYNGLVFEFVDTEGSAIVGGGRYDGLISHHKQAAPSIGFGLGIERLINLIPNIEEYTYFNSCIIVDCASEDKEYCLGVLSSLRERGISSYIRKVPKSKIVSTIKEAEKRKIKDIIIIGDKEISNKTVSHKNIETGCSSVFPIQDIFKNLTYFQV